MSFKNRNFELFQLLNELIVLRLYNKKQEEKKYNFYLLYLAEGVATCVALDALLVKIPAFKSKKKDSFRERIRRAFRAKKPHFLLNLKRCEIDRAIDRANVIRNSILHGDFTQIANHYGLSVNDYFGSSKYIQDIEFMASLVAIIVIHLKFKNGRIKKATLFIRHHKNEINETQTFIELVKKFKHINITKPNKQAIFKNSNLDFSLMCKELMILSDMNKFIITNLILNSVALERFLRINPIIAAGNNEPMNSLIQKAFKEFNISNSSNKESDKITYIRNSAIHLLFKKTNNICYLKKDLSIISKFLNMILDLVSKDDGSIIKSFIINKKFYIEIDKFIGLLIRRKIQLNKTSK